MGCVDRAAEVDASIDEEEPAEIRAAVLASLNSVRASGPLPEGGRQVEAAPPTPADPLAGYLSEPLEPDWSVADEVEVASWLTARLAAAVADAADRPAALQKVWRLRRSQVSPQHLDLVEGVEEDLVAGYLQPGPTEGDLRRLVLSAVSLMVINQRRCFRVTCVR